MNPHPPLIVCRLLGLMPRSREFPSARKRREARKTLAGVLGVVAALGVKEK